MPEIKAYEGRVPACGCFCGACPILTREKKPCLGASLSGRCGRCTRFQPCCEAKGLTHCHECPEYPCAAFRRFSKSWLKYGQDLRANQELIRTLGVDGFKEYWNAKAGEPMP